MHASAPSQFYKVYEFNCDISNWDVSSATGLWEMFQYASSFNADLSKWNVAKGTTFRHMVRAARPRGGVTSKQLVGAAAGAASLNVARAPAASQFSDAESFNADLSKWDVAQGTDFRNMVRCARPRGGVTS